MLKNSIKALALILLLAAPAWGATDYFPLRFTSGDWNDLPDSVRAYVYKTSTATLVGTVKLTAATDDNIPQWYDSLSVTVPQYYSVTYKVFYPGPDSAYFAFNSIPMFQIDTLESMLLNTYANTGANTARVKSDMIYYEGSNGVDAEIQSEATDALNAYDPPTNAEMEARTLVAASYFDATADPVATVTTVTNSMGTTIGAAEVEQDAADKIGFYTQNMGDDSAAWISGTDTSAMMHLRLLDAKISGIAAGSSAWTAAGVDSVYDFILATWTPAQIAALITAVGAIRDSMDEASATAAGAAGTGALADTIYAIDTSGTDTAIPSVAVTARNAAGTQLGTGITDGSGRVVLNLPQSTVVSLTSFLPGYTWNGKTFTSSPGTTDADSVFGYNIAIAGPSAANLKRIYSTEVGANGDTLSGCTIVAQLVSFRDSTGVPFDTSTGQVIGFGVKLTASTGASGQWTLDLIPNNYISPARSVWHVYCQDANKRERWRYNLTLTGTATDCLQHILGTGSCP